MCVGGRGPSAPSNNPSLQLATEASDQPRTVSIAHRLAVRANTSVGRRRCLFLDRPWVRHGVTRHSVPVLAKHAGGTMSKPRVRAAIWPCRSKVVVQPRKRTLARYERCLSQTLKVGVGTHGGIVGISVSRVESKGTAAVQARPCAAVPSSHDIRGRSRAGLTRSVFERFRHPL